MSVCGRKSIFLERVEIKKQMFDFREILSHCDLHDLGFLGAPWTFDNGQDGDRNVKVRLDRAVANPEWMNIFPNNQVNHIVSTASDHCPIEVCCVQQPVHHPVSQHRRYEAFWEKDNKLTKEVELAWSKHRPARDLGDITANLSGVMSSIHDWSKRNFGSITKKIKDLQNKIQAISHRNDSLANSERKRLRKELDELQDKEEIDCLVAKIKSGVAEGGRSKYKLFSSKSYLARKEKLYPEASR